MIEQGRRVWTYKLLILFPHLVCRLPGTGGRRTAHLGPLHRAHCFSFKWSDGGRVFHGPRSERILADSEWGRARRSVQLRVLVPVRRRSRSLEPGPPAAQETNLSKHRCWHRNCRRRNASFPQARFTGSPRKDLGYSRLAGGVRSVASISRMPPTEPRMLLASKGRKILVACPAEIFSSDSRYFSAMR